MTTWMNESDIDDALRIFDPGTEYIYRDPVEAPNLLRGAQVLSSLRDWTDSHSDGWVYWPKPSRAANKLQTLLSDAITSYRRGHDVEDLTPAQLSGALSPIKAFLTRQGVDHSEVFR